MEKIDYKKGVLLSIEDHNKFIPLQFMDVEKFSRDKKYYIKILPEEEARTLRQNDTLHGLLGLLVDTKWFDDMDIAKDAFAYKLRDRGNFIKHYICRNKGQKRRHIKVYAEAIKFNTCEPVHRSTALLGKKDFATMLDYVLNMCEKINKNGDGFGSYSKKYEDILIGLGMIRG